MHEYRRPQENSDYSQVPRFAIALTALVQDGLVLVAKGTRTIGLPIVYKLGPVLFPKHDYTQREEHEKMIRGHEARFRAEAQETWRALRKKQ